MMSVLRNEFDGYTVLTVSGVPEINTLVHEVAQFLRSRTNPKTVWDFSACDMSALSVSDYEKIIAVLKRDLGMTGDYRSALIVSGDLDQILGETFEVMASAAHVPVGYGIFGDLKSGVAWLHS